MRIGSDRGRPRGTPGRSARTWFVAGALALALALPGVAQAKPAESHRTPDLTGQFLVATPEMKDPRFARAVILVVHHDATGAMGLVVNRPLREVPIATLLEGMGLQHEGVGGSMRVHWGGPVEPGRVFVIHSAEYATGETHVVADGIALTTPAEILRTIGAGKGPGRAFLVLGYSGWRRGQLDEELRSGAWVAAPAEAALVFGEDYDTTWQRVMARRKRGTVDL